MTKKDFILIARCILDGRKLPTEIRICGDNPKYTSHEDLLAEVFADRLAEVNPSFNRDRFLKACGVEILNNKSIDKYICDNCSNSDYINIKSGLCFNCDKASKKCDDTCCINCNSTMEGLCDNCK